jgi:hypothetical protein
MAGGAPIFWASSQSRVKLSHARRSAAQYEQIPAQSGGVWTLNLKQIC